MKIYEERPIFSDFDRQCYTCGNTIPKNTCYMMMERPQDSDEEYYRKCIACHKGPLQIVKEGDQLFIENISEGDQYERTFHILAEVAQFLEEEGPRDVFVDGVRLGKLHLVEN